MKLMHLSDLHLGKRLIEVSLIEDQAFILNQIVEIAAQERPQAVLIAGDIYDRSNPSAEAMALFAQFLRQLSELNCKVLVISGNHDSAERIAYLNALVKKTGVYLSPVYDGRITPVILEDEYGDVHFWPVPFVHPEQVRALFPDETIATANDAMRVVMSQVSPDPARRNVALSHQFISGSAFDAGEQRLVGTLDNVDPGLYDAFDYVALGHIHGAQNVGRPDGTMRYCGTPLKYSRKEADAQKSVTLVTLGAKGDVRLLERPLRPLREVRVVRGCFSDLLSRGPDRGCEDDYYFITLTDETDVVSAAARLRERYPKLLALEYDNARTRNAGEMDLEDVKADRQSPMELIEALYRMTHGREMSDEARAFAGRMMRETEGFS